MTHPSVIIDCIPDVHFAPGYLDGLAKEIDSADYTGVLFEYPVQEQVSLDAYMFGKLDRMSPESLPDDLIGVVQLTAAKKDGVQEALFEFLRQLQLPVFCIEDINHVNRAIFEFERLRGVFMDHITEPLDMVEGLQGLKDDIQNIAFLLFTRREIAMANNSRYDIDILTRKGLSPRLLLVTGVAHAAGLEMYLNDIAEFAYLIDLDCAKSTFCERFRRLIDVSKGLDGVFPSSIPRGLLDAGLREMAADVESRIEKASTFAELRDSAIAAMLWGFFLPLGTTYEDAVQTCRKIVSPIVDFELTVLNRQDETISELAISIDDQEPKSGPKAAFKDIRRGSHYVRIETNSQILGCHLNILIPKGKLTIVSNEIYSFVCGNDVQAGSWHSSQDKDYQ